MTTAQSDVYKAVFADKDYYMKIALMNSEGDLIVLKKSALRYLEIVDNVFNPFHEGDIIITNDYDILEKGPTPFAFLGNGRDMLYIDITPQGGSAQFTISLRCVITECIEMTYQNSLCKKMSFVEMGQYAINEKFCSALSFKADNNYLNTNAGSSQSTGSLIKKIINSVFNNPTDDLSLFDVDQATGQPMFDQEDCGNINVSPYSMMSYGDLLSYVMQMHTHKNSPCVLQHDRTSKKFQLTSMQRLFEDNKRYTKELFRFADPSQIDSSTPAIGKSAQPTVPNIKFEYCPVNFGTESQIAEFFTEAPAAKYGVNHFANQAVTSYSKNYSTFLYNLQSLNKTEYTKAYTDLFVRPFEKLFEPGGYKLQPNFYPVTDTQQQKWVDSTGTLPAALNERQFANQKMMSLLYLNYTYIFKMVGNTSRQSRCFIDIYKRSLDRNSSPSRWDCNTLGRHFVTCVKHIFTHNTYHNQVETIKPYRITDPAAKQKSIADFLK